MICELRADRIYINNRTIRFLRATPRARGCAWRRGVGHGRGRGRMWGVRVCVSRSSW
jgi:hypothetical protein